MFQLRSATLSQFHPENVTLTDASYLQTELLLFVLIKILIQNLALKVRKQRATIPPSQVA
jgi:hypothetical protein